MSFSQGLKIGLFLMILGLAMLHASRTLTLCGGVLQTFDSPPNTTATAPAPSGHRTSPPSTEAGTSMESGLPNAASQTGLISD